MMDPVRQALYARLAATTAVTTRLADGTKGIWHRRAHADAGDPLVIFERRTGIDFYLFGDGKLEEETWMVKAVSSSASATPAEDIAGALNDALHDAPLAIAGYTLLWLRRQSTVDYAEPDGQMVWHHVGGIYRLATEPT